MPIEFCDENIYTLNVVDINDGFVYFHFNSLLRKKIPLFRDGDFQEVFLKAKKILVERYSEAIFKDVEISYIEL